MTATVLVLGSPGGGDDAVGLQVGKALDGARRGESIDLVELLGLHDLVVLVDAVVGLNPGQVGVLGEADLDGAVRPVSSHALSVPLAIKLARTLEPDGGRLVVVGIGIAGAVPGATLSPEVAAAVPEATRTVQRILAEHAAVPAVPRRKTPVSETAATRR